MNGNASGRASTSGTAARRGPYAKTAGRVEHILDVALQLFAANGYRATTMKEIAEGVGISQPGLMHHFPGKQDILIAVLRRWDDRSPARSSDYDELPLLERLLQTVDYILQNRTSAALHCVLSAEATDPRHPAHAYFKERYGRSVARATASFEGLRRRGVLRPGADPAALARMLIALLDGLQLQWLLGATPVDFRAELRQFVDAWTV
ncbi:TetR/AcrR family transcriptional regulator [Streptomyces sp. NPDC048277]|uniref:TetR/AcrR family transcriptional regulator n=1 Tax=Streptomyces sp. NPDC048277 TaxID=3155027 RepID=UPI0033F2DB4A